MARDFTRLTEPVKYKYPFDDKSEFYYCLSLPDPDNAGCHIFQRSTATLWAFTDSQDKAKQICDALNAARRSTP